MASKKTTKKTTAKKAPAKKATRKPPAKKATSKKAAAKKAPAKRSSAKIAAGTTKKAGTSKRLPRNRSSKYQGVIDAVQALKPGQEHLVPVPAGMDSARFRNNLYHAVYLCREDVNDGKVAMRFARTDDLKHIIIAIEK